MFAVMTLLEHLKSSPFTLALSSGFFGFFAHAGLMRALEEQNLKPSKFTGASAGAIVAAAMAHGMSTSELEPVLRRLKKEDFWDPSFGLGLLRGAKLEAMVRELLSERSQQVPLAISVFDIFSLQTRSMSGGDWARAVCASCAVPLMFQPVRMGKRLYWDGGVKDKMALHGTPPEERVLVSYLPGRDFHSIYERKRDVNQLTRNRSALVLTDLPAVNPNALNNGFKAFEEAYRKTRRALQAEYSPHMQA